MSQLAIRALRRSTVWLMLLVALGSLVWWGLSDRGLWGDIRIATAVRGGRYFVTGDVLGRQLAQRTGAYVQIVETDGTHENRDLLLRGEVELAFLQLGSIPTDGISALSPLYPEVIHVLVRREGDVHRIAELEGHSIAVGPEGSGMRDSAETVLEHYRVSADLRSVYFTALGSDPELDAAIVTTGYQNADLTRLIETGEFRLIPIGQAPALSILHSYFDPIEIPRGLYSGLPPIPETPITTLSTMTFLAAQDGASARLVTAVLDALHGDYLAAEVPGLISGKQASTWSQPSLHPAARSYYDPYEGLGILANLMESLAAAKELLFALGAGVYLFYRWWQAQESREREALFSEQKERLDTFLEETVRIERSLMSPLEPPELRAHLAELTRIKLEAIAELTSEELRGDRMFSIFLTQCSAVSHTIETRLAASASEARQAPPDRPSPSPA